MADDSEPETGCKYITAYGKKPREWKLPLLAWKKKSARRPTPILHQTQWPDQAQSWKKCKTVPQAQWQVLAQGQLLHDVQPYQPADAQLQSYSLDFKRMDQVNQESTVVMLLPTSF